MKNKIDLFQSLWYDCLYRYDSSTITTSTIILMDGGVTMTAMPAMTAMTNLTFQTAICNYYPTSGTLTPWWVYITCNFVAVFTNKLDHHLLLQHWAPSVLGNSSNVNCIRLKNYLLLIIVRSDIIITITSQFFTQQYCPFFKYVP